MRRRPTRSRSPVSIVTRAAVAAAALLAACSDSTTDTTAPKTGDINKVNHVVVIFLENHSFDNLYGEFAGAEGLSAAAGAAKQVSATGAAYATLPEVNGS